MGRRPPSRDQSPSPNQSPDGPAMNRRRKRQPSAERRRFRSRDRRSRSGSAPVPPRRRGRRSPPPPSRSPPARGVLRSRSRSRSGPPRRRSRHSRRRGRGGRGGSPSQGRWQPSRSPEDNGRDRDGGWSPHRRGRPDNHRGPKPEGCRTIWVGWTDKKPEEEDVIEFFKDCGPVTEVRTSERHVRGYFAHVTFEDTECVDQAMKKAGEEFMGQRIQLDFAYMDKVATNPRAEAEAPSSRRYRPKSVKPPNGHTLWVGDVSIDATEQDIIDLFESCGKIEMISLKVNQLRNGQFGHMKFFETEAVDKAVELAGTAVRGVPIRLDFAEDKPIAAYRVGKDRAVPETQKPEDCRTIWVGGLPSDATEEMIVGLFERCGEIREVRLDRSKRSGTLFCHVEFGETTAVDRAVRLSGERLNSSKIRVDFAENRKNDGRDGGNGRGKYVPPPGEMMPHHGMPPHVGPPGGWMGPPPGYPPPPGMFMPLPNGGPPPGYLGGPPPGEMPPGHFTLPPRPSGAPPGPDGPPPGPDGNPLPALPPSGPPPPGRPPPPSFPGGPPPGFHPPSGDWRPPGPDGYPPMRPPDFYSHPPPYWGPPPPGYPGYPPPPGYPHPPPGPDGFYGGPTPGYPGPPPDYQRPPGPPGAAAPSEAPKTRDRSRSAKSGSCYSSYSYSYSVSPERK